MSTATSPLRRENIPQLNIVRALCIIAVLCVHSTSFATEKLRDSNYFFLYNFVNIFMKYGTPSFIFLSSFVLFYNYFERPFTKSLIAGFYTKRLKYILVPYFMFSVLYYAISYYLNNRDLSVIETLQHFGSQLLIGKAYTHLYFVFINAQFYLFFPLALWFLKKHPAVLKWCIPLGLAIQYGFVFMNKFYWQVKYPGSWMFSYMAYFLLGAFLGSYFPKIKQWLIASRENATPGRVAFWILLWAAWLTAALNHVNIYYQSRLYGTVYNTTLYEFLWNAHTYLGTVVLLQIAFFIYRHVSPKLVKWISQLGALSFGIYLLHPLFNLVYRANPVTSGNSMLVHLWYIGGFFFALVCSWIVVGLVVRYVPFSWIIFGNSPAKKVKKGRCLTAII